MIYTRFSQHFRLEILKIFQLLVRKSLSPGGYETLIYTTQTISCNKKYNFKNVFVSSQSDQDLVMLDLPNQLAYSIHLSQLDSIYNHFRLSFSHSLSLTHTHTHTHTHSHAHSHTHSHAHSHTSLIQNKKKNRPEMKILVFEARLMRGFITLKRIFKVITLICFGWPNVSTSKIQLHKYSNTSHIASRLQH